MKIGVILTTAALLATASTPGAARADEPPSTDRRDNAAVIAGDMNAALAAIAARLDLPPPDQRAGLEARLEPILAVSPDEPEAAFHVGFEYTLSPAEAGEPDAAARPVFADAAACQANWPGKAVVYFERLSLAGGRGHHCVVAGPHAGENEDGPYVGWAMLGDYRLQTAERGLFGRVAAATASDDYEQAATLGEARLAHLSALSRYMGAAAAELMQAAQ